MRSCFHLLLDFFFFFLHPRGQIFAKLFLLSVLFCVVYLNRRGIGTVKRAIGLQKMSKEANTKRKKDGNSGAWGKDQVYL